MVKPAMCHIRACLLVILAGLSTLQVSDARAQAAGGIEQAFAASLTSVPSEALAVSGAFYVPV